MQKGNGRVSSEYVKYIICKKFHWTPAEYDNQDFKTLNMWKTFMNIEGEESNKKSNGVKKQTTKSNFR